MPQKPKPLQDPPPQPVRDPPGKPLHDQPADPTREPNQPPIGEPTPGPGIDPPLESPGDPGTAGHRSQLTQWVKERPDITLSELQARWRRRRWLSAKRQSFGSFAIWIS
jgi:hypothetical protein